MRVERQHGFRRDCGRYVDLRPAPRQCLASASFGVHPSRMAWTKGAQPAACTPACPAVARSAKEGHARQTIDQPERPQVAEAAP